MLSVAAGMLSQPAPVASQASHWYAKVAGTVAVQTPGSAVRSEPAAGVPSTAGATVLSGGGPGTGTGTSASETGRSGVIAATHGRRASFWIWRPVSSAETPLI